MSLFKRDSCGGRACLGLLVLVIANAGSSCLCAQGAADVKIQRIEFVGNRRVRSDTLKTRIFSREGDLYNEETLRRDFQALWNSQFFEDIKLRVEDAPGVANATIVVFEVKERPQIRRIRYDGIHSVSESDILDRFKERKVGLSVESQFDPTKIKKAQVVLKELLGEHGCQFAKVTPQYERIASSNAVILVFKIDEGPKVKVGKIKFTGNHAFSDRRLARAMRHDRPYAIPLYFWKLTVLTKTYDRQKLSEDLEHGGWSGYYFGLNRKQGFFNVKTGQEISETFGSRVWNQGALFDYNADFIFQSGRFGTGRILAGAISSNDGITLHNLRFQPRLAARFDYASGDSDQNGKNLNTFSPLFPNPQYSSISALLGPSNLTDVGPLIHFTLNSKTAIAPEMPFYWRSSIHDGIYNFAGVMIRPGNLSTARFVGYQPGLVLERTFPPHFSSSAGYFYFFTGQFLHETPADKGVGYFYATMTFRF